MWRPGRNRVAIWSALQLLAAGFPDGTSAQERGLYLLAPSEIPKADRAPEEDYAAHHAAREAYLSGLAAFQRGEYAAAAALFVRADDLSSSPNPKLMLGRCLRLLNKLTQAYRVLLDCVRQAETVEPLRYAKTRIAANAELDAVREQIGLLTVYVHTERETAQLHVSGQPVPRSQWQRPIPVAPGVVKLSLETQPGLIEHREIEIAAGETASAVIGATAELSPRRAPPELDTPTLRAIEPPAIDGTSPLRVAGYVVAGAGVAGLITFGVLGAMSAAAFDELERSCPSRVRCDAELRPVAERGRMLQTGANVALVAGATALATGVALFAIGGSSDAGAPSAEFGASPAGVQVRGAF